MDPHALSLGVRAIHVAAMAVLIGGGVLIWTVLAAPGSTESDSKRQQVMDIAASYEWLAWLAIGLLIMTGIGNLGAFGLALPAPQSAWGERLILKLVLVLILVVSSLLRTFLIAMLHASPSAGGLAILRRIYAGTAGLATGVLVLAVALAHG